MLKYDYGAYLDLPRMDGEVSEDWNFFPLHPDGSEGEIGLKCFLSLCHDIEHSFIFMIGPSPMAVIN